MTDLGNDGGNLDIAGLTTSWIPAGLIRAQAPTVDIYVSDPDTQMVINSHGVFTFHGPKAGHL